MNTDAVLFEAFAGNDVIVEMEYTNDDGTPVDLTGCTLFLTAKRKETDDDVDALIAKMWATHTDPTNGITEVALSKEETALVGRWPTDVQLKDAGGKVRTLVKGYAEFHRRVTLRTS
jgi:hypothetical protein